MMDFNLKERHLLTIMRKDKGLTQGDVANAIGLTQGQVSHYEVGASKFSKKNYIKYKDFIINYEEENEIINYNIKENYNLVE